jgi:hypothetical protein
MGDIMTKLHSKLILLIGVLLFAGTAMAQSVKTEHTFKLDDADSRVPATLEDVAWMVGSWGGEAFGGTFEEVWNPPSLGTMVGMFKVLGDEQVVFYELLLLAEEEGSLVIKVKHFHPDFTAWEEKDDYVTFRLVSVGPDAAHFSGLSFYRISDDEIHAYIALHNDEKVWEEKLVYRRTEL